MPLRHSQGYHSLFQTDRSGFKSYYIDDDNKKCVAFGIFRFFFKHQLTVEPQSPEIFVGRVEWFKECIIDDTTRQQRNWPDIHVLEFDADFNEKFPFCLLEQIHPANVSFMSISPEDDKVKKVFAIDLDNQFV